jgi:hypothetical protein
MEQQTISPRMARPERRWDHHYQYFSDLRGESRGAVRTPLGRPDWPFHPVSTGDLMPQKQRVGCVETSY